MDAASIDCTTDGNAVKKVAGFPGATAMNSNLSDKEFRDWNEQMMRIHDNEAFHSNSNWLVHSLASLRVAEILRLLQCGPEDTALDVGCGAGIILNQLTAREKTGVDLCTRMLERARIRCGSQTKLVEASAEHLPFGAHSFSRVLCSEVIGHVQSPEFVVREVHRVLKPDGVLVVTVPASLRVVAIKQWLKRLGLYTLLLGSRKKGVYCPPANDDWYLHHFSPRSLKALLGTCFEVQDVSCVPNRLFPIHYIFHCRPKMLRVPNEAPTLKVVPAVAATCHV